MYGNAALYYEYIMTMNLSLYGICNVKGHSTYHT